MKNLLLINYPYKRNSWLNVFYISIPAAFLLFAKNFNMSLKLSAVFSKRFIWTNDSSIIISAHDFHVNKIHCCNSNTYWIHSLIYCLFTFYMPPNVVFNCQHVNSIIYHMQKGLHFQSNNKWKQFCITCNNCLLGTEMSSWPLFLRVASRI